MKAQDALIRDLLKAGVLGQSPLRQAFETIDRADFVLPEHQMLAYQNHPLSIGFGQTISQPFTVAFMLNQLQIKSGEKILEIGAGSGWQTALLSFLAGKKGKVIAIERIPQLAKMASDNLEKYPQLKSIASFVVGDGSKGIAKEASFDKVIAAASAREIPQAWKDQLRVGGRIVAPVGESIVVVDKIAPNKYQTIEHYGFVFVPLIED